MVMNWHDIIVRCSALQMYLLITPVDGGSSLEMTLFDTKGRDKETQTFPSNEKPEVLWKTADEWITWHTLSEKRRHLRAEKRREFTDRPATRWGVGLLVLVLTASLFVSGAFMLFSKQRMQREQMNAPTNYYIVTPIP